MRISLFEDQMKKILLSTVAIIAVAAGVSGSLAAKKDTQTSPQNAAKTATPIKHLVVIFGENRSYDHYFGTYPYATNPQGEPVFKGAANTPKSNNYISNPTLLSFNGNSSTVLNGTDAANPFRMDRSQANTRLTFNAAADAWWTAHKPSCRPKTIAGYEGALAHLRPEFGAKRLAKNHARRRGALCAPEGADTQGLVDHAAPDRHGSDLQVRGPTHDLRRTEPRDAA